MIAEVVPDPIFQFPFHRVNNCNLVPIPLTPFTLSVFQFPFHRVNNCNPSKTAIREYAKYPFSSLFIGSITVTNEGFSY